MKNLKFLKLLLPVFMILPLMVQGQNQDQVKIAKEFLIQKSTTWELNESDLEHLLISDTYLTRHNGVRHIYFQQSVDGIPIYNSVTGVHVTSEGRAYGLEHRFVKNARSKVTSDSPEIDEEQAVRLVAEDVGVSIPKVIEKEVLFESGLSQKVFEASNISHEDIKVKPVYVEKNQELRLAWDLSVDVLDNADYLSYRVDAVTGEILQIHNWTTYCQFDHDHAGCGGHVAKAVPSMRPQDETEEMVQSGTYRVFALPAESPNHGPHVLVSQPHLPGSSPFGWHDIDGDGNPDFTITRGNNVHAYPDLNDQDESTGGEPDGGASLTFDYVYNPDARPINSLEAATTNLFYMNNMIHDVSYIFGFDESAGNFQENNRGLGGQGGDYVRAEAQDGSGTNNANFATPADGGRGRMQMFVWNSGGEVFSVLEPSFIAKSYETGEASFGPSLLSGNIDIEAEIVEAFDADPVNPSYCCGDIINPEELDGKIALVDRGSCAFDRKVRNCEDAGAIAVLVCNFAPNAPGMGQQGNVIEPTIPSLMLGVNDCAAIRVFAGKGAIGKIKSPEGNLFDIDGDFDNGIIAHEYAHGISNRLTGGPSRAGCLGNAEQMGEGWSDFYSLIMTAKEGDQGTDSKGIGTFAQRQDIEGPGIRPRPYTTDMSINEMTYGFVARSEISQPHGIGSVWCTMLWDLYWALADEYGFDPDFKNESAGNNIAIQLVMDGMKLQSCSPGFVDGRDAILLADSINNEAANSCLIWEVFARRGLGYYADQGSSGNRNDGIENFEPAPSCQNKIRFSKSAINIIEAGDTITYTLVVENNKVVTTSNVIVNDIIPDGCTYVANSATSSAELNGNVLVFELGDMEPLQRTIIQYKVVSGPTGSATLWIDDLESGRDNWIEDLFEGFTIWDYQDDFANSGEYSYLTENADVESDQILTQIDPVVLNIENPGMRFYHWYSTSAPTSGQFSGNIDGAVIEASTDGTVFRILGDDFMIRNGYNGPLPYGTFTLPNLSGFYGNSGGFVDTYVDLEQYKDESLQLRFRFGTEADGLDNNPLPPPAGWVIDDIEYLDLKFYKTPATVSSDDGDNEIAELPGKGTLVEPNTKVGASDIPQDIAQLLIYPNPVQDNLKIKVQMKENVTSDISIFTMDGKKIRTLSAPLNRGVQIIDVPVSDIQPGNYLLEMTTEKGSYSQSWIKL